MSSILHRSFADFMGFDWPKEVACVVDGRRVTWSELHDERKRCQALHLKAIRDAGEPTRQAAQVWVFFVPGMIYGGWHLYLRTFRQSWWLRRAEGIALDLMKAFPCGVLPVAENFYEWKKAFAASYACDRDGRKQGIVRGWIDLDRAGGSPRLFIPREERA